MLFGILIGFVTLLFPFVAVASIHDESLSALEALVADDNRSNADKGVATYYATRFAGRRTTSGERYNPDRMTAAHATLPLGSVVKVQRQGTDDGVIVRINDRCSSRHASRNLIDLSRLAAMQIGVWGKGMTRVMITHLKEWSSEDELLLREMMD